MSVNTKVTMKRGALGDEHQGQRRVPGQLGEVVAVHSCTEAGPFAHKALVGDASRHGDVIKQVPAAARQTL